MWFSQIFTFKRTLYLTDGMLLMDTTWSGGEENLLWRCGMTCMPVDPGQKAGLVAVEPMDPDQSETLWGLLDSSWLTCGSARTLQHFDVTFIVFPEYYLGFEQWHHQPFLHFVFSYWHKNNKCIQTSCSEKLSFITWNTFHNKHMFLVQMWTFVKNIYKRRWVGRNIAGYDCPR